MNKKLLLLIAIVAGIAAVVLVQRHVDNLVGETITVYKATADTGAGTALGSNVEAVTLPAGLFPDIFEEAPNQDLYDYITSTPLRAGVSAGDILLYRHFDSSVDQGVLPAIPAGMKAISIPVDQNSSVSYFIQPGDLIDVMGTFKEQEEEEEETSALNKSSNPKKSTRPILQAVEVLAVGSQYRPSDRQRVAAYSTITLLVTMEEAAKLIFARDFYSVKTTLVLRSKDDDEFHLQLEGINVDTDNFEEIGNLPTEEAEDPNAPLMTEETTGADAASDGPNQPEDEAPVENKVNKKSAAGGDAKDDSDDDWEENW